MMSSYGEKRIEKVEIGVKYGLPDWYDAFLSWSLVGGCCCVFVGFLNLSKAEYDGAVGFCCGCCC